MLADMAIGIETSRLAVQRSAWEVDQVSGLLSGSLKCFVDPVFVSGRFPGVLQQSSRVFVVMASDWCLDLPN